MKNGKKEWLLLCNRMLSGVLALLGFTSCDGLGLGQATCEYGQPYAKYEIKGKVVDTEQQSISNARIIVKPLERNSDNLFPYAHHDTVYTQKNGEYLYENHGTSYGRFRVVCDDPSGTYKPDSTVVEMKPTGGKGWYEGSDSKVENFELKKKEQ